LQGVGGHAMNPDRPNTEARFDDLWQQHAAAVVRYARRRVPDPEVDEVVAETFLVAWRRLDEVPAFALPWLLRVARGVSANVHRSARRRDALQQRLTSHRTNTDPVTAGPLSASSDRAERVSRAVAQLREQDRELLTLIAWDGLTHAQAAEAMGCRRQTFAVRLHRARRRLRDALERETADELETARGLRRAEARPVEPARASTVRQEEGAPR
jgi:RNA polymerase sigma-70 factor, ECF subfamily